MRYPLSLKQLSEALHEVPQAQELTAYFYGGRPLSKFKAARLHQPRQKWHHVIAVYYENRAPYFGQPPIGIGKHGVAPTWRITMSAIAADLQPKLRELLIAQGVSRVKTWLEETPGLIGTESFRSFSVYFDEDKETLEYRDYYHP